jgi:hypothetical protein
MKQLPDWIKASFKYIYQSLFTLVVCIVLGALLMFTVYHVPVNEELKEDAEIILEEQNTSADYPLIHAWEQYFTSFRPGVFDGGSTTIIVRNCYREVDSDYVRESIIPNYSRYWHGYVVLWRPLLYFLNYKDLEILLTFLLFFLAMLIASDVRKKKTLLHAICFWVYFTLTMPMVVGMCLQYVPLALIICLGLLFYLNNTKKLSDKSNAFYVFFIVIGVLTNYTDLLTYPLCTWGIIVVWTVIMDPVYRKPAQHLFRVVVSGISWIIGYGGMWVGKAVYVCLILGRKDAAIILREALYRSGNGEPLWNRFNALYLNWRHYMYPVYAGILLACFAVWFVSILFTGWRLSEKRYALGLIILSSPVWYFVLGNHTRIHHLFTYRIYGVMIMAALGLIIESMPGRNEKIKRPDIRILAFAILCFAPALLLTLVTYEETEISNKTCAYPGCHEYVADSVSLEMDFVPAQKRVTGIGISVSSESTEGEFVLQLLDESKVLYEEHFEINPEYYYKLHAVNWYLEKGRKYQLKLESIGNDEPIHYYQFDGDETLNDIGPGTLNGVNTGNESLFGVLYWFRPYSKPRKVFMFLTYYAFSMFACYVFSGKKNASRTDIR